VELEDVVRGLRTEPELLALEDEPQSVIQASDAYRARHRDTYLALNEELGQILAREKAGTLTEDDAAHRGAIEALLNLIDDHDPHATWINNRLAKLPNELREKIYAIVQSYEGQRL